MKISGQRSIEKRNTICLFIFVSISVFGSAFSEEA